MYVCVLFTKYELFTKPLLKQWFSCQLSCALNVVILVILEGNFKS